MAKDNKPIESEKLIILKNAVAMAKYDLSKNQQKVFLEVAMMAKNNPDEKFYKLYIREFLKNIGVSTNDTAELKREIEEMRNITIHIPMTKKGGELKANFFASVELFEGSRYVEIELSDKLKPYFIEIAEGDFFHYQIQNTRVLKSGHSIRMYLYLKSWRWTGKASIKYDELRSILGVKPDDYKLFGDFKRRVLDKTQKELKEKTDISFEYSLVRRVAGNPNTPVVKINFFIIENGKKAPITEQKIIPIKIEADFDLVKLANSIGQIDESELSILVEKYTRDRIHDVLLLASEENNRGNKIRSLTAYLHNALKNNSAIGKSKQSKPKNTQHIEIEKILKNNFNKFKEELITRIGSEASPEEKNKFFDEVKELVKKPQMKSIYMIGDDWNFDAMRNVLGKRLLTYTDYEIEIMLMKSIGKPAKKENGFWKYDNN